MLKRLAIIAALCGTVLGQGYSPVPVPKMQFFTNNGAVASGYKVCSYQAGTTTPLNTYTDASGGVPNTNPVVLDSAGRANIWLGNTSYKLVLLTPGTDNTCSTGSTIWTVDSIGGYCTLSGCGMSGPLTITSTSGTASLIVSSTGNPGVSLGSSGTGSTGATIASSGTGATTGALISTLNGSAGSVALIAKNSNNSGDIFQAQIASGGQVFRINSTGVTVGAGLTLTLAGAGGININGGSALTTSNQTGTGSIVMSASPTITGTPVLPATYTANSVTITQPTQAGILAQLSAAQSYQGMASGACTASVTLFPLMFGGSSIACTDVTGNGQGVLVTTAGTVLHLYVASRIAGAAAGSGIVTIKKNGSATAVTCTVGTSTSCNDTTHSFAVVVGDKLTVSIATAGAETLADVSIAFEKN